MTSIQFRGTFTALITPFTSDNRIDYDALTRLIEHQIQSGVAGLVPMGTTGESPTLSHQEHIDVVAHTVKVSAGRVLVIAGTGSNNTQEALQLTQGAKDAGADAALIIAPYYNKPSQEGLYQHFKTLADVVDLPQIIYNILGRTAVNISTDTLMRLAQHKNIVGVKEASGDMNQMMEVIAARPENFSVLCGDDSLTYSLCALGGDGVISVASNIIPERMSQFVDNCLNGNYEVARDEHYQLLPLFNTMFIETNPVPVKTAVAMMQGICPDVRLPMCQLQSGNKERLQLVLEEYDLISNVTINKLTMFD